MERFGAVERDGGNSLGDVDVDSGLHGEEAAAIAEDGQGRGGRVSQRYDSTDAGTLLVL